MLEAAFPLILNVISSVGIVYANKKVYTTFSCGTTLTVFHFIFTFACVLLCARVFKLCTIPHVPVRRVIGISLAFSGYVVFNNLSLLYNSVSFYQTAKIACTPLIILIEYVVYHKKESRAKILALIPTLTGCFITVYNDSQTSFMGCLWAFLAIISNSLYTVLGKRKTQELNIDSFQVLYYQAPISAFLLVFTIPFFDDTRIFAGHHLQSSETFWILLSCCLAFGVNFSFFLFVKQTSPLTANVLGYFKTCMVYLCGFIVGDVFSSRVLLGISVTLAGSFLYTYVSLPKKEKASDHPV